MKKNLYLTFSLNNYLYGVDTVYVEEIFNLPELTTISEVPNGIIGFVNLRGEILPVMDLNLKLGYLSPDSHLTDSVVVLKYEKLRLGILVNQIHEIREISLDEIATELNDERKLVVEQRNIITGVTHFPDDILILNNPNNWLYFDETQQLVSLQNYLQQDMFDSSNVDELQTNDSDFLLLQKSTFCQNATLEERKVFKQRADNLRLSTKTQDFKNFKTLAIITLNDYLFGVDLEMVREFTDIYHVTPIPCCPSHIIGNMNLRGEILTLIDLRGLLLNVPSKSVLVGSKVMVIEVEGIVAGVIVEEIYDVMFSLNLQKVTAIPTTINSINAQYCQGAAPYQEKIMSILDIPKIFLKGGLIVDEAV
ncbi:MAG: chemotaxis protein CheW [Pelatocladus maniniholoensis HA4357-MV3]|jgi:purine-binding chemotaxis protein CheW|uniref:Chemotaxis protein CheW n=1 Tax=Pelatocladus maniniholoensis HA4357-MV3 TaxID=1117104 RepID=A0A9E3H5Q9_9NOST|nr:chemotaxis protein CheW [Pelatocladus maniniholoensis HA4357-MV3]